jgi:hypothetical protein
MFMDERVFTVFFKQITAIVEALQPFTLATIDIYRMWYGSRGFFLLSPEGAALRRDLIRQAIRYSDWGEKFSAEYLGARLREIIEIHALQGPDEARESFRSLVTELDAYAEEHTVYLPIFGIDIPDAPTRTLGGIVLHQASSAFLESIASGDTFTVPYLQRQTDAEVWAEVHVIGEPKHAVVRAEEACGPSIDVLRFWMGSMTKKGTSCAIGLQGDVVTTERPRIIVNKNLMASVSIRITPAAFQDSHSVRRSSTSFRKPGLTALRRSSTRRSISAQHSTSFFCTRCMSLEAARFKPRKPTDFLISLHALKPSSPLAMGTSRKA